MKILLSLLILFTTNIYAAYHETDDPYFQDELRVRGLQQLPEGMSWDIEPFRADRLYDVFHTDNEVFNDMMMKTHDHIGVPYVWGGNSWNKGIDCSHYTRKIYQDVGIDYGPYIVTDTMRRINNGRHFKAVSFEDARPGDLLVYGYHSMFNHQWHGHVVILISKDYRSTHGKYGLVSGAHGKVGVQFISYNGFPNYYRYPFYKLRKILRVKGVY